MGTSRATRRRGVVFALAVERNGSGDPHEVTRQSRPWRRCLLNLGTIGEDGNLPFERCRGQSCVFGESVWYKPGPLSGRSKADDRMMQGRFVAPKLRTSEYVVVSDGESVAARTIKRMPEEDRWTEPEKILDVEVLPWDQPGRPARSSSQASWRGPAPTAGRVGPRAARLTEAQRLQRARLVGELPWLLAAGR